MDFLTQQSSFEWLYFIVFRYSGKTKFNFNFIWRSYEKDATFLTNAVFFKKCQEPHYNSNEVQLCKTRKASSKIRCSSLRSTTVLRFVITFNLSCWNLQEPTHRMSPKTFRQSCREVLKVLRSNMDQLCKKRNCLY